MDDGLGDRVAFFSKQCWLPGCDRTCRPIRSTGRPATVNRDRQTGRDNKLTLPNRPKMADRRPFVCLAVSRQALNWQPGGQREKKRERDSVGKNLHLDPVGKKHSLVSEVNGQSLVGPGRKKLLSYITGRRRFISVDQSILVIDFAPAGDRARVRAVCILFTVSTRTRETAGWLGSS